MVMLGVLVGTGMGTAMMELVVVVVTTAVLDAVTAGGDAGGGSGGAGDKGTHLGNGPCQLMKVQAQVTKDFPRVALSGSVRESSTLASLCSLCPVLAEQSYAGSGGLCSVSHGTL